MVLYEIEGKSWIEINLCDVSRKDGIRNFYAQFFLVILFEPKKKKNLFSLDIFLHPFEISNLITKHPHLHQILNLIC